VETSLFSTSLTALGLREAIQATAEAGYDAIELGCFAPHLTLEVAETRGVEVREWLAEANLPVSALSLTVEYTAEDEATWAANVDETLRFIRLCQAFGTRLVKTMPGRPGSAQATDGHRRQYRWAMDLLVPEAKAVGVQLAVETHLNHLSDSIATAARCLDGYDPDVLGVNLDFCNVHTCGENALDAIDRFRGRILLTHVKDSLFTTASGEYVPLGHGKMDYPPIIRRLREVGYDGYLSVECLYPQAKRHDPRGAVANDRQALSRLLAIPRGM
jgi:protein FrlC